MTLSIKYFFAFCWALAILILMIEPVQWLINTWFDPAYDSQGLMIAGLLMVLLIWSLSSPRLKQDKYDQAIQKALLLFMSMALIRLAGQFLGINMLSALALVVDVYAMGILLGLGQRKRALSPAWIALLFAFSLPIERIIQRLLGFPLQLLSANGSCSLLSWFNDGLQCNGVEMFLNQQAVLVDLPCSGARGLIQLFILFTLIGCIQQTSQLQHHRHQQPGTFKYLFIGFTVVVMSAYIGNVLRISILALGIAYPDAMLGINVMAAPWHDIIGLVCLLLSALAILIWSFFQTNKSNHKGSEYIPSKKLLYPKLNQSLVKFVPTLSPLVVVAILISLVPAHPLDVVKTTQHLSMPRYLNGFYARQHQLSEQEQLYFTQYGGNAHKASYGDFALLQVSTRAPLRHLHDPQECLSGSGHEVQYLGYSQSPLNAAVYKSLDPQGKTWRISVTFLSSQGQQTTNIAEAIWLWLKQPASHWIMLQRISPWDTPPAQLDQWDKALIQAMEINLNLNSDSASQHNSAKQPKTLNGDTDHANLSI